MHGGRVTAMLLGVGWLASVCDVPAVARERQQTRASAERPSAFSLCVDLVVGPPLDSRTHRAMAAEADRIWRAADVALTWRSGNGPECTADALRAIVSTRQVAADGPWPVGELRETAEGLTLALVSIAGAQRVLTEARAGIAAGPRAPDDRRLALVLGRALAHEIGHYLLATPAHARRGLMRARHDPREWTDARAAAEYLLDEESSRRLHRRLADTDRVAAR